MNQREAQGLAEVIRDRLRLRDNEVAVIIGRVAPGVAEVHFAARNPPFDWTSIIGDHEEWVAWQRANADVLAGR